MKAMRNEWKTGAALVVGLGLLSLVPRADAAPAIPPGAQVIDAKDLMARLQRLERDMRDVQAETFKKTGAAPAAAAAGAPPAAGAAAAGAAAAGAVAAGAVAASLPAPEAQPQQPIPDLTPLVRRMDELEDSISRLTGQMEEIGHQVDQLSQRTDRLQKQLDYQAMQTSSGALAAGSPAPAATAPGAPASAAEGTALASLTPPAQGTPALRGAPPANLGQIPATAPLPTPAPRPAPADAKGEFDSAMNLLSRAQYDPARDAFRKFADAHPEDDRAADALYWTGDIA